MKRRIFLDTNIAIDYLAKRMPFGEDAMKIFSLSPYNNQLCISALSFTTIFYVLRKHIEPRQLIEMLDAIQLLVEVLPTSGNTINQAVHSEFQDFEDAVQYFTALEGKADYIITRNPRDFKKANIPVYTPSEFLSTPYWMDDTKSTVVNESQIAYNKK